MERQICPWCDSEIVWDEEIGPEETCPFCENELKGYRTIQVGPDDEEETEKEAFGTVDEDEAFDEETLQLLEQLEHGETSEQVYEFEQKVEQYIQQQEETLLCSSCQGEMIFTGQQHVDTEHFQPIQGKNSFLCAPFTLDLHVCPHCFEIKTVLSREDRLKCL
ncbi:hypothetical protein [Marinicrinis lubricantis]|uniref:Uncharacterized protein n=1 Tax=Marinicrinis lubricantis TaxID=2086470 RepID=A0ABW1ILJ5_9BACL